MGHIWERAATGMGDRRPGGRRGQGSQQRVTLAIGTLLALPLFGAVIAGLLISGIYGTASGLADREVRYAAAVNEAALLAKAIANDERGFLLSGRPEFLDQMQDRSARARAAFDSALAAAVDDRQLASVLKARDGFERWLALVDATMLSAQTGDRPAAVDASLGPSRALRKSYEASLADAGGLAADGMAAKAAHLSLVSTRSTIILMAYVAMTLLVGGAIAIWMMRTMRHPAYARLRTVSDSGSTTDRG